jgi:Flp pilus assembly protein TadD
MFVRYSLSMYEALALSQIFANKIDEKSPLKDFFEELQLTPSAEKNVELVKSRILAESFASKALEQIFDVLENPERLYTVFVKTHSEVQVLNFFEKNKKIVPFSNEDQIVHLDSTLSRDDLANFVSTQIGETTDDGSPLTVSLSFVEFLVLSAASALSRTSSKDSITNLLGEASFTKKMLVTKFSASDQLVFNVTSEMKASMKDEGVILKAADSLIQKGFLNCSKSDGVLTVDDRFTEITNVLSSPDLVVVVCNSDFSGSFRCFSFVKSWDKELISIVSSGNQTVDSVVTVERRFSSELKGYVQDSLYSLRGAKRVAKVTQQNSLQKGQQFIQAGKFGDAVTLFHEALRLTPNDSDVWYWLGVSYHRMNLLFDAVRCYNKAVNLDSNNAKAWFDLGFAHYQMNEYPEAAKCFSKITEINPQPHDAWFWAGLSYGNYGEFKLASNYLSEAAQRKPDDPQIWYSLGQASVEVLNQSRNEAEAKKMAKSALQYLRNAEEKGIKKVISKDNYNNFTAQIKQLADLLAN